MSKQISKDPRRLPKWAQERIQELEGRIKTLEAMIPWTEPNMEWFTLFWPGSDPRSRPPMRLFTCSASGTLLVCTLDEKDWVFVGRGKNVSLQLRNAGADLLPRKMAEGAETA